MSSQLVRSKGDLERITTSQVTIQEGLARIFRDKWDRILNKQVSIICNLYFTEETESGNFAT